MHKATWVFLDGQTMNQIYYTLTDRRQATRIIMKGYTEELIMIQNIT